MLRDIFYGSLARRSIVYGYSNARIGAMKASLLRKSQIQEMIQAGKIASVLGLLDDTDYKEDLVNYSLRYGGADLIELALGRNLARTCKKLIRMTPKGARKITVTILERWDVHNIKTILSAKSAGYKSEEIEPFLVVAGNLTIDELKRMLDQGSVEEAVNYLGNSEYGKILKELLPAYKTDCNITPLLSSLDVHYYGKLTKEVRPNCSDESTILFLIKTEIDMINIMLILRTAREGIKGELVKKFMILGGSISNKELGKLMNSKDMKEIVTRLKPRYDLTRAYERYNEDKSLTHFEVELETAIAKRQVGILKKSILSTGTIIGFLYLKENEVNNIRKIVRAKEFNIPPEKVQEMVVMA